jgi:hypothetical protein
MPGYTPPLGCVGFASIFHLPTAVCGGSSGLAAEVLCASKPFLDLLAP